MVEAHVLFFVSMPLDKTKELICFFPAVFHEQTIHIQNPIQKELLVIFQQTIGVPHLDGADVLHCAPFSLHQPSPLRLGAADTEISAAPDPKRGLR